MDMFKILKKFIFFIYDKIIYSVGINFHYLSSDYLWTILNRFLKNENLILSNIILIKLVLNETQLCCIY